MNSGWLYLAAGTIGEVAWVLTLKPTAGFTKLFFSLLNLTIAFFNIWVLSKAFHLLPTALSYSIWVGASAVLIAGLAWRVQGESMSWPKVVCMGLVLVGIVGLKWVSTGAEQ